MGSSWFTKSAIREKSLRTNGLDYDRIWRVFHPWLSYTLTLPLNLIGKSLPGNTNLIFPLSFLMLPVRKMKMMLEVMLFNFILFKKKTHRLAEKMYKILWWDPRIGIVLFLFFCTLRGKLTSTRRAFEWKISKSMVVKKKSLLFWFPLSPLY